jgi:hypothetical protein
MLVFCARDLKSHRAEDVHGLSILAVPVDGDWSGGHELVGSHEGKEHSNAELHGCSMQDIGDTERER